MTKRTDYRTCPGCGDNLDPGEICKTCKEQNEVKTTPHVIYPPCLRVNPLTQCDPKAEWFTAVREDSPNFFSFLYGAHEGDMLVRLSRVEGWLQCMSEADLRDDDRVLVGDYVIRPTLDGCVRPGYYKVSEAGFKSAFTISQKFGDGVDTLDATAELGGAEHA